MREALCRRDEVDFQAVEMNLLRPLERALKRADTAKLESLGLKISQPLWPDLSAASTQLGKSLHALGWENEARLSFSAYHRLFQQIETVRFEVFKIWSPVADREAQTLKIKKAELHARMDVRGVSASGERRNDVGQVKLFIDRGKERWRIQDIEILHGRSVIGAEPSFQDVTSSVGLANLPVHLRREAIRRGGYSLSAKDFNQDGYVDLFVGAMGAPSLFWGGGKGFVPAELDSELSAQTLVKSSVIADFDKDGFQDLLLVRFIPQKKNQNEFSIFYGSESGWSSQEYRLLAEGRTNHPMPVAVGDFNEDGLLDVYVGFPGARDFTVLPQPDSMRGQAVQQSLFFNQGDRKFTAAPDAFFESTRSKTKWFQEVYPHSSLATDLNQDGHLDLIVVDDRGGISPIFLGDGAGRFYLGNPGVEVFNKNFGMSVAVGDLNSDGRNDLVMTNVNFLPYRRMRESCFSNWGVEDRLAWDRGLRIWMQTASGRFQEISYDFETDWAGEGLAGVELIDYDSDGLLDVYVTNGLWSGEKGAPDISSLFVRAFGSQASFRDLKYPLVWEHRNYETSEMMQILMHPQKLQTGESRYLSMAGYQNNRLYKNLGDGRFMEVAYAEAVDSIQDGYMAVAVDYDQDGYQDLVLRNADPGSDQVRVHPVQVFKNIRRQDRFLTLKLEDTQGHEVFGAFVQAENEGEMRLRYNVVNNGTIQGNGLLHIGLGEERHFDKLKIRWNNGKESRLESVEAGFHKLIQPEGERFTQHESR